MIYIKLKKNNVKFSKHFIYWSVAETSDTYQIYCIDQ